MADDSRSSSEVRPRPLGTRLLLPSVADIIFIALLSVLTFTPLSVRLLGDAGIGWHIRTGQQILSTHTIPHVDSFSATMQGQPWFAWEWLYDIAVGWLDSAAGLNGVVLLTALLIAVVFACTFRWLIARGTNLLVAVLLVLLAASASMIHFLARPHIASWLFTLAWFWILDSSERACFGDGPTNRDGRALWLLPLSMLVWVNVHGGFIVGFVLLGIYFVSAAWKWIRTGDGELGGVLAKLRAAKRARMLVVMALLSALATLANPYGWNLHIHVYQYLSNRFLMDHIDEFQSPNFHGAAERCFALLLLVVLVGLARRGRELRLSQGFVVLFAVYSGLYAARNIPAASLLLVLVVGPLLTKLAGSESSSRSTFLGRMNAIERRSRGHLWPIVTFLFVCWIALHGGDLGQRKLMDAHFSGQRFPVNAVEWLKSSGAEPLLAPDAWGGYLIYCLYPQVQVIVDDRHDLYGEAFLESYVRMVHLEPGWDTFLREHKVRRAILPKGSPLANILAESKDWQAVYHDDVAIGFVRTSALIP